jgi:hypothetical protein
MAYSAVIKFRNGIDITATAFGMDNDHVTFTTHWPERSCRCRWSSHWCYQCESGLVALLLTLLASAVRITSVTSLSHNDYIV